MRFARPSALLVLAVAIGAACSSTTSELATPTSVSATEATAAPADPAATAVAVATTPAGTTDATTTSAAASPATSTESAPVDSAASESDSAAKADPPATGVPGASSADGFCLVYGQLALSTYLVGLSEAYSTDPLVPRRVEAVAASTIASSFRGALDTMPPAVSADKDAFQARWSAYAERVSGIGEAIYSTSLSGELLPGIWTQLMVTHDRNDPDIPLDLPVEAMPELDTLAAMINGSYAGDAAVAAGASAATPLIDDYVSATCPDVAEITIGDAV